MIIGETTTPEVVLVTKGQWFRLATATSTSMVNSGRHKTHAPFEGLKCTIVEIRSIHGRLALNCMGILIGAMISSLRDVGTPLAEMIVVALLLWLNHNLTCPLYHWLPKIQILLPFLTIINLVVHALVLLMMLKKMHCYWTPEPLTIWHLTLRISQRLSYHGVLILLKPMVIFLLSLVSVLCPYLLHWSYLIRCLFPHYLINSFL